MRRTMRPTAIFALALLLAAAASAASADTADTKTAVAKDSARTPLVDTTAAASKLGLTSLMDSEDFNLQASPNNMRDNNAPSGSRRLYQFPYDVGCNGGGPGCVFNKDASGVLSRQDNDIPCTCKWLRFHSQSITGVAPGTFANLPDVKFIYLYDNEITSIGAGVFVNCPKLYTINLSGNKLAAIGEGVFVNLPSLGILALAMNVITTIAEGAFVNLPGLQVLYLQINKLTLIGEHALENLPRLWSVWLYNNPDLLCLPVLVPKITELICPYGAPFKVSIKDCKERGVCKALAPPPSVDLKSAASYAVLAGSTITSTGNTLVTGHLGLDPGTSVTGFKLPAPGRLNTGSEEHIDDQQAVDAKSDLAAAMQATLAIPATTTLWPGADVSHFTFPAGVYAFPSSMLIISGDLTLDGQDKPHAEFIFKTGTTLILTTGYSVVLKNKASSANVFWLVGSSATLGVGTTFHGTIMAEVSITVTTSATVFGRVLANGAAVTLDTNVITLPQ